MNWPRNLKAALLKLSLADYSVIAFIVVLNLVDGLHLFITLATVVTMYNRLAHKNKESDNELPCASAYTLYFALSFAAALLTPSDILTSYPILKNYFADPLASLVSFWLPIHKISTISDFPEVTLLVFSLLVIFFPVVTAIYVYARSKKYRLFYGLLLFKEMPRGKKFVVNLIWVYVIIFCLLFLPGELVSRYDLQHSDDLLDKCFAFMFTSRIGLGLVAAIFPILGSLMLGEFIIIHKEIFLGALKLLKSLKNAAS
jgi:hypothetical protein